jgi:ferredoxin
MKVHIDRATCESNGICIGMAPDLFELDGDYPVGASGHSRRASGRGHRDRGQLPDGSPVNRIRRWRVLTGRCVHQPQVDRGQVIDTGGVEVPTGDSTPGRAELR